MDNEFDLQEYLKELEYQLENQSLTAEERGDLIKHLNICRAQYLDYCLQKAS